MPASPVEPQAHPPVSDSSRSNSSIWLIAVAKLAKRALSRPLLPLVIGLVFGLIAGMVVVAPLLLGGILLLAAVILLWAKRATAFMLCALVLLGASIGSFRVELIRAQTSPLPPANAIYDVVGMVASAPAERQYSADFLIDVTTIDNGTISTRTNDRWAVFATGAAAEAAKAVQTGDTVKVTGLVNPFVLAGSVPAWQKRLIDQGVRAEIRVRRLNGIVVISHSSGGWIDRIAAGLHDQSVKVLRASLTNSDASVVAAIFLGDKDRLDPAIQSEFQATGTVHLLATAGLHIGILLLIYTLVAQRLTVSRKWMAVAGIVVVWLYALMAGGRPSVTRAAFVASIYFAAIILERIPDLLSALSLCAIVLLWENPRELQDVGFQFTFLTVLGITALMPALMDVWKSLLDRLSDAKRARALKHICEVESLSLAAQASSAPLVALYFNLVTIYGLTANLLAVPLMFVLLPLTLIVIALGSIWTAVGSLAGHLLLTPVLHAVLGIIGGIANLPHCAVSVASPSWYAICGYYIILFGGSFAIHVVTTQARSGNHSGDGAAAAEPAGVGMERTLAG